MPPDGSDECRPDERGLLVSQERLAALSLAGGVGLVLVLAAIEGGLSGDSLRWLLLSLWAAVVCADERAFGPLILHQPIVAGSVTGFIMGEPAAGLAVGFVLQAVWPGLIPLGGTRQPVIAIAALGGAAWLSLWPTGDPATAVLAALTASLLGASAGVWAEGRLRRRNEQREAVVYGARAAARTAALGRLGTCGLLESALMGPLTLLLLVLIPWMALRMLASNLIPEQAGLTSALGAAGMPHAAITGTEQLLKSRGAACVLWVAMGGILGQRATGMRTEILQLWHGLRGGAARTHPPPPTPGNPPPIPPEPTTRQLWALLTLQASFSHRHLQRGGFLRILHAIPTARLKGRSQRALADLQDELAHEGTANTQPVVAAALAGGAERILTDAARAPLPRSPLKLLTVGGSVLAQWADRALWGGLRPALGLLALGFALESPAFVLGTYAVVGLGLHLVARRAFYRWGWRLGWDLVRGGRGRTWRWLPTLLGLTVPLLVVGVSLLLAGRLENFLSGGGPPAGIARGIFRQGIVWFILGLPLGYLVGRRALLWGWTCTLAGWVGLVLTGL